MVIKYNGYYIDANGDTVSVTTKVTLLNVSHNIPEPDLLKYVILNDPIRHAVTTDCDSVIYVEDNFRNRKQEYHYHNGHYAKLFDDGEFWINSNGSKKWTVKLPYSDDDDDVIQTTIDIARKLWHIGY